MKSLDVIKKAENEAEDAVSLMNKLNNKWLFPTEWNQPDFDLFCLRWVDDKVVLRCIQVTSANRHGLKLEHFGVLATRLHDDFSLSIHGIEIFMAIPDDINEFQIASIQGQIRKWHVGSSNEYWHARPATQQVVVVKFRKTE